MISPKVWVVQEGNNDYSVADNLYGIVTFVTKGDLRGMEGMQQNIEVMADIRSFLSLYIAGVDYIIPAGNPMVVALVTMALPPGDHKFLKWDGRRSAYVLFNLNPKSVR